jgi:CHC2-type zinc finger protein
MGRVDHDYAQEIRRSLTDPVRLCEKLGLLKGSERQSGGVICRCPAHRENNASCSVRRGKDGTIAVKCFSCDWTGDALTLVAMVFSLDIRSQFREVLTEAANLAGLHQVVEELRGGKKHDQRALPEQPEPEPDRDYPDAEEVSKLWSASGPVDEDQDSRWHFEGRGIDASSATRMGLARALVLGNGTWCQAPQWARYRGAYWPEHGFRVIVPVYDAAGSMRSVRAWRVTAGEGPKRLPPAGHRAAELVLANGAGVEILSGKSSAPCRAVIVEGEPDFLVWALRAPWHPVFGVLSGSWSPAFAKRIPYGSEVIVRTHHDEAGDRYAADVIKTTRDRAVVRRSAA